MRRPLPPDGHQFLARFSDEVHEIALCLRDRVFKVMPNIHESVYDVGYTVSMVYGSTERQRDAIVYVASYSKHANLGFSQGALLDDPEGVLVGTGTRMRHAKFEAVDQVRAKWLDAYLRAALEQAGCARTVGDRMTTVRSR